MFCYNNLHGGRFAAYVRICFACLLTKQDTIWAFLWNKCFFFLFLSQMEQLVVWLLGKLELDDGYNSSCIHRSIVADARIKQMFFAPILSLTHFLWLTHSVNSSTFWSTMPFLTVFLVNANAVILQFLLHFIFSYSLRYWLYVLVRLLSNKINNSN